MSTSELPYSELCSKKNVTHDVYRYALKLGSGATLKLIIQGDDHCWRFGYDYIRHGENREVLVRNDVKLNVNYHKGQITDRIELSMHVIFPGRFGKEFVYGVDVSPGAKTFYEFGYERVKGGQRGANRRLATKASIAAEAPSGPRQKRALGRRISEDVFRLATGQIGARKLQLFSDKPGLIKQVELPFPIPDLIEPSHGTYSVPFKLNNESIAQFQFPTRL